MMKKRYIKDSNTFIMEALSKRSNNMGNCITAVNPKTGEVIDMTQLRGDINFIRGTIGKMNACLGELCDHLTFIYTWDVATQATDGSRLFMNPSWTVRLTDGEKRFVMLHELLHCVFGHISRGKYHEHTLSNIAADYECNNTALVSNYVNKTQLDHIGAYYSKTFGDSVDSLWGYESIYAYLKENPGKVPVNPTIDLIMPEGNEDDPNVRYEGIHTSSEWKEGHKDAMGAIHDICIDEYDSRGIKDGDKMTKDELVEVVKAVIPKVAKLQGDYPRAGEPMSEVDGVVEEGFQTYEEGWDYAVEQAVEQFGGYINALKGIGQGAGFGQKGVVKTPACDPTEKGFPFPKFGQLTQKGQSGGKDEDRDPGELNRGKAGTGDKTKRLSNNDIISQQEGAEIAKRAGYDGDDIIAKENTEIDNDWKERVSKVAGKDGSELLTRHIEFFEKAKYDWKYELRRFMNAAMQRTKTQRNIWGHKNGLARGVMKLKHKTSNNAMKDLVFLIDCSGSITDSLLSNILSESYCIAKCINLKDVTYAYFTTRVELVETTSARYNGTCSENAVMLLKNVKQHPKGGHISGGTDFKNALEWVQETGGARCVILFTDGYDEPVPAPPLVENLIWCVYDYPEFKAADNSKVVYLESVDFENGE